MNARVIELMGMPWTISQPERSAEGDYLVMRVAELPELTVTGSDRDELERNFWEALEAVLQSYVDYDETPPLPPAVVAARALSEHLAAAMQGLNPFGQASSQTGAATSSRSELILA